MLENITHLITREENEVLIALPTREEVKAVVFEINVIAPVGQVDFLDIFFSHAGI